MLDTSKHRLTLLLIYAIKVENVNNFIFEITYWKVLFAVPEKLLFEAKHCLDTGTELSLKTLQKLLVEIMSRSAVDSLLSSLALT